MKTKKYKYMVVEVTYGSSGNIWSRLLISWLKVQVLASPIFEQIHHHPTSLKVTSASGEGQAGHVVAEDDLLRPGGLEEIRQGYEGFVQ
jgi:hypothetical protein